jgi:hypothetical protein
MTHYNIACYIIAYVKSRYGVPKTVVFETRKLSMQNPAPAREMLSRNPSQNQSVGSSEVAGLANRAKGETFALLCKSLISRFS